MQLSPRFSSRWIALSWHPLHTLSNGPLMKRCQLPPCLPIWLTTEALTFSPRLRCRSQEGWRSSWTFLAAFHSGVEYQARHGCSDLRLASCSLCLALWDRGLGIQGRILPMFRMKIRRMPIDLTYPKACPSSARPNAQSGSSWQTCAGLRKRDW